MIARSGASLFLIAMLSWGSVASGQCDPLPDVSACQPRSSPPPSCNACVQTDPQAYCAPGRYFVRATGGGIPAHPCFGRSWEHACPTIQHVLALANADGASDIEIRVASGTYFVEDSCILFVVPQATCTSFALIAEDPPEGTPPVSSPGDVRVIGVGGRVARVLGASLPAACRFRMVGRWSLVSGRSQASGPVPCVVPEPTDPRTALLSDNRGGTVLILGGRAVHLEDVDFLGMASAQSGGHLFIGPGTEGQAETAPEEVTLLGRVTRTRPSRFVCGVATQQHCRPDCINLETGHCPADCENTSIPARGGGACIESSGPVRIEDYSFEGKGEQEVNAQWGGGLWVGAPGAPVTLRRCEFHYVHAAAPRAYLLYEPGSRAGGGAFIISSTLDIELSTFDWCTARSDAADGLETAGGGLYFRGDDGVFGSVPREGTSLRIHNCRFARNLSDSVGGRGGGVFAAADTISITEDFGGRELAPGVIDILWFENRSGALEYPLETRCEMVGPVPPLAPGAGTGGGAWLRVLSGAYVYGVSFARNGAEDAGAIYVDRSPTAPAFDKQQPIVSLLNCLFYENRASFGRVGAVLAAPHNSHGSQGVRAAGCIFSGNGMRLPRDRFCPASGDCPCVDAQERTAPGFDVAAWGYPASAISVSVQAGSPPPLLELTNCTIRAELVTPNGNWPPVVASVSAPRLVVANSIFFANAGVTHSLADFDPWGSWATRSHLEGNGTSGGVPLSIACSDCLAERPRFDPNLGCNLVSFFVCSSSAGAVYPYLRCSSEAVDSGNAGVQPIDPRTNQPLPVDATLCTPRRLGCIDLGAVEFKRVYEGQPLNLDRNGDGEITPDDLADMVAAYFSVPPGCLAEFNQSDEIDPDDLSDYIATYFGQTSCQQDSICAHNLYATCCPRSPDCLTLPCGPVIPYPPPVWSVFSQCPQE